MFVDTMVNATADVPLGSTVCINGNKTCSPWDQRYVTNWGVVENTACTYPFPSCYSFRNKIAPRVLYQVCKPCVTKQAS